MARIPIAVQLFSVRHECEKDLPSTLAAIKAMGYEGVEFAGWYGYDAAALKKLLDDNGLLCAGAHVGIDTLRGDALEASIEFHRTLGNKYLIVPWLPAHTSQEWKAAALELSEISAKLAPHGMRTGYHNHHVEFAPAEPDGALPWDTFFGNADPSVIMQFDTGNALHGGGEAVPFLTRYPGRAVTVHLKDYDLQKHVFDPPVGEGSVPFKAIFDACETAGNTTWYIVEYEADAYPPLEGIDRCLKNLKAMGK